MEIKQMSKSYMKMLLKQETKYWLILLSCLSLEDQEMLPDPVFMKPFIVETLLSKSMLG